MINLELISTLNLMQFLHPNIQNELQYYILILGAALALLWLSATKQRTATDYSSCAPNTKQYSDWWTISSGEKAILTCSHYTGTYP